MADADSLTAFDALIDMLCSLLVLVDFDADALWLALCSLLVLTDPLRDLLALSDSAFWLALADALTTALVLANFEVNVL